MSLLDAPEKNTPTLPPEIEKKIFSLAVMSAPSIESPYPINILSVCRRVYEWTEPLRFKALFLSGLGLTYPQFRPLLDTKSPEYLAKHVKHVYHDQCFPLRDVFELCIGITDLILIADVDEVIVLPDLAKYLQLKHLAIDDFMSDKFNTALRSSPQHIPTTLTHIHWAMEGEWQPQWDLPDPALVERHMPVLTHFMTDWAQGRDFMWKNSRGTSLPKLASLKQMTLVALIEKEHSRPHTAPMLPHMVRGLKHPKIVFMETDIHWNELEDWRKRLRGEDHVWLQAERLLEAKRIENEHKLQSLSS
ncbi:hypothetical protein DL96DRAFT_1823485 [Flagelloscypha sp. PMI_526]|nr:hypothetical protein DL96DRAFT_1823485 [Flagelloscypha sp. PMI_526]